MKKRIFAGVLTFVMCLSLVQPAMGAVTYASDMQEVGLWSWVGTDMSLPEFNGETQQWELSVPQMTTKAELLDLLPEQVEATLTSQQEGTEEPSEEVPESEQPDGDTQTPDGEPEDEPEPEQPDGDAQPPDGEPEDEPEPEQPNGNAQTPGDEPKDMLESEAPVSVLLSSDEPKTSTKLLSLVWDLQNYPAEGGEPSKTYAISAHLEEGAGVSMAPIYVDVFVQPSEAVEDPEDAALKNELAQHIVEDPVSPSGTVINLFDYWTAPEPPDGDGRFEDDYIPKVSGLEKWQKRTVSGINQGAYLKFAMDATPFNGPDRGMNSWTRSEKPYSGIVQPKLEEGYPVLSAGQVYRFIDYKPEDYD